jgi:hypothetical protein
MNLSRSFLPGFVAIAAFIPTVVSGALIPSQDGTIVYDTVNNISWLADVNLPASHRFGVPVCNGSNATNTCVNASGSMSYQAAAGWINAMNAANYLGHANWQFPTTPTNDSGCGKTGPTGANFGFGCTTSAFGSLWNALGLKAPNTAVPIPTNTVGPFSNLQPYLYWSQSGAPPPAGNFTFSFATGWQGANTLPNFLYALPMIPGKLPGTPAATGNGLQVNPGGQTIYDPVTNITWLANANLAATNAFGLPACKDPTTPALCVALDGAMTFASASQFIANMNSANYLGQTNWQLPTIDSNCPGYKCAGDQNPMGNLFYGQLGFSQGMTAVTAPNIAVGSFHDIQPYLYWSCQAAAIPAACQTNGPAPNFEWSFSWGSGFEGTDLLANDLYVTAYFVGAPANLCTYSLSSGGQSFTAAGGTGTITITTSATCPWSIGALPAGVTITSPSSGTGNGTVTFQVSPTSGADSSNSFTIAGTTFTIEQQASAIPGLSFVGSFPHLAAEGGWNTTFTFVNKISAPATARTSFFAPTGPALTLPIALPQQPAISGPLLASSVDQTVPPNASLVMQAVGPANVNYLEGSAQLQATNGVDGFEIFHYDPTQQEAVVPLETRNASSYLLPFDNTNNVLTGVALGNVSSQAASIPVVVRDDTGKQIGASTTIPLNAFGHTSFVLSQSPGGQISVLGIRYTPPGTLTTIPALANVSTGGLAAHIASGNGWRTTFVLVNIGASTAQAQLSFFDDNGIALPLPLTFPQSSIGPTTTPVYALALAPGASLWIQSAGSLGTPPLTGSAQLTANGNIQGFVIFHYIPNGQEAVVPLESRSASGYVLAFDNTNGTVTGIAISDVSSQPLNVSVILRDDAGAILPGPSSLPLAANGHYSQMLTTPFPATAGLRGTVEFDSPPGSQISVVGIRSPPVLTFTTLPPMAK